LVVLALIAFGACEEPDASFQTSPAVRALLGTTSGTAAFNPPEAPPKAQEPQPGWGLTFSVARFGTLENNEPALQVTLQVETHPGAGMEIWLYSADTGKTVARWTGGATTTYEGTICFELAFRDSAKGIAAPIPQGNYRLTAAFRDPNTGIVVARDAEVTGNIPVLTGKAPPPGSNVFWTTLACKRGL
jgi:hypothetical protein